MSWGRLAVSVTERAPDPAPRRRSETTVQWAMDAAVAAQMSGRSDPVGVPAVFAAVRLIASSIDQLRLTAPGDPQWLRDPRLTGCPYHQSALVQMIVTDMLLRGAAFLRVERVGTSWMLLPLDPDAVQVLRTRDERGVIRPEYTVMGDRIAHVNLPSERAGFPKWTPRGAWLLHIPYLVTSDHPEGVGPLQIAREALQGYAKVERQAGSLLDGGTHSGGVLETDQDITAETGARWQERWTANRRAGKIPVLGSGLRYRNEVLSPRDAMWLESRQFNAGQVAQMFGIPPDYLGMAMSGGSSSLSYSNSSDNDRRFRRNCLEGLTGPIGAGLSTLLDAQRDQVEWDWAAWEAASGREEDQDG